MMITYVCQFYVRTYAARPVLKISVKVIPGFFLSLSLDFADRLTDTVWSRKGRQEVSGQCMQGGASSPPPPGMKHFVTRIEWQILTAWWKLEVNQSKAIFWKLSLTTSWIVNSASARWQKVIKMVSIILPWRQTGGIEGKKPVIFIEIHRGCRSIIILQTRLPVNSSNLWINWSLWPPDTLFFLKNLPLLSCDIFVNVGNADPGLSKGLFFSCFFLKTQGPKKPNSSNFTHKLEEISWNSSGLFFPNMKPSKCWWLKSFWHFYNRNNCFNFFPCFKFTVTVIELTLMLNKDFLSL